MIGERQLCVPFVHPVLMFWVRKYGEGLSFGEKALAFHLLSNYGAYDG